VKNKRGSEEWRPERLAARVIQTKTLSHEITKLVGSLSPLVKPCTLLKRL
jgi:hypothetical protein